VISEIIPGSPLSDAKLLPGDRVVAINEEQVETARGQASGFPKTQFFIDGLENICARRQELIAIGRLSEPIVYGTSGLSDVNESAYVNFRRGINI
jgi:hypothetical protein